MLCTIYIRRNTAMITKTDVVRDLRRVYNKLGEPPTEAQYDDKGEYSSWTVRDRFGSFADARAAAGLDSGIRKGLTKDEIADSIRELAAEIGRPPSQSEYSANGRYTVRTVYNHFESWMDARAYADLEGGPTKHERQSDEALLAEIHRLAEEKGRVPTQNDMKESENYSAIVYRDRFGSWNKAVRKAGYEPRERGAQPGDKNPAWKGGSIESYYGPNWDEQRQKSLERDDYECQHCGMTQEEHLDEFGEELNIHHIINRRKFIENGEFDYERANRLENLVALCTTHHKLYDHSGGLRPHNVPNTV